MTVSSIFAPADAEQAASNGLTAIVDWLGRFSALDWILVAIAISLVAWAWVRAMAPARLGTIEIGDLAADSGFPSDGSSGVVSIKAELQRQLGERGWLPTGAVPSGSPTVASLASAVGDAPVPQAKWIADIVSLIPFPPTATSFKLTGTLRTSQCPDGSTQVGITYQLSCLGPETQTKLDEQWGSDWPTVIDATSKEIYRAISQMAPAIYPRWARWESRDSLTCYRAGLLAEHPERQHGPCGASAGTSKPDFGAAYAAYRDAAELDPENMLARLRAANCAERTSGQLARHDRLSRQIQALESYISVHLREPNIFEAGFRASVVLSSISEALDKGVHPEPGDVERLWSVLRRLERQQQSSGADAACAETSMSGAVLKTAQRVGVRLVTFFRPSGATRERLTIALQRAALTESDRALKRLRPLWTVLHEGRFRHRFEPTGGERRRTRRALAISRMCVRARSPRSTRAAPISDLVQLSWRGWVYLRYMAGRSHIAGWQAHYNAACFYALLPEARECGVPFGSERIRRRALWHLARAVRQADGALSCQYVRDQDRDLDTLRRLSPTGFEQVLGTLCGAELLIHYFPPSSDIAGWGLHVWGPAIAKKDEPTWQEPLKPVPQPDLSEVGCLVFRVNIFDENENVSILPHTGDVKDAHVWTVRPVDVPPGGLWLYSDDPAPHLAKRLSAATPGSGGSS